jgi:hypothetical protein
MATAKKQASKPVERTPKKLLKKDRKAIRDATRAAIAKSSDAYVERIKKTRGAKPFPYTAELGERIGELIIGGVSLMKISKLPGMPSDVTMFKWVFDKDHPFSLIYARAKQIMVLRYEEEINDIADTPCIGETTIERSGGKDGGSSEVRKADMIQHRQLQVSTRQWALSYLAPKKHGKLPDLSDTKKNEQLESLFASLKSGPAES